MRPKILVVDDNAELLALLSQLFADAGYEVLGAKKGRAGLELAREGQPQLAVLDMLLPDLMGQQLAEQLHKEHPGLPVIFITGVFRGGKHAAEARGKPGVVGYFEKPFDAAQLLAAVQKVVPAAKPTQPPPPPEDEFEVELDIDVEEDEPPDPMELTGRIRITGSDNISAELRGANLTAAATPKGQAVVLRQPQAARAAASTAKSAPRGELKDNLPALFTAFYLAKETGELGVQRGKVKKVIYFERGQPVFALSNMVADRFGQFLVRVGKVQPETLSDAMTVAKATGRRTGDVLIERGQLKETERLYFVGQQVKSIIYSLFGWEDGGYVMTFKDKAHGESIKLDVHPATLIFRGVKKLYKPERMRRLLPPETRLLPSAQPAFSLEDVELDKWEASLLPRIDGTKTVAELMALAQRPEGAVMSFLCAMVGATLLESRDQAPNAFR